MPEPGVKLTRHHPLPPRYLGYTAMDWLKFYGVLAVLWFMLVLTYTRYFHLFDDIGSKPAAFQMFVKIFAGSALALALPAVLGFFWWASGALVKYSRWQAAQAAFWRWFWMIVLVFYFYVEFDPLDRIHPVMSRQGLAPAPNLLKLFDGQLEWFMFQWGYFLLWFMFWFLVVVLHWQYILDGLRDVWFFSNRVHRYGSSVLTGFRETARMAADEPVTPAESAIPAIRGVPRLAVDKLTESQAAAIIAADASCAIAPVPGQPAVLFIDLGCYDYSPALAELAGDGGGPLLLFDDYALKPAAGREELVIPLRRPEGGGA